MIQFFKEAMEYFDLGSEWFKEIKRGGKYKGILRKKNIDNLMLKESSRQPFWNLDGWKGERILLYLNDSAKNMILLPENMRFFISKRKKNRINKIIDSITIKKQNY